MLDVCATFFLLIFRPTLRTHQPESHKIFNRPRPGSLFSAAANESINNTFIEFHRRSLCSARILSSQTTILMWPINVITASINMHGSSSFNSKVYIARSLFPCVRNEHSYKLRTNSAVLGLFIHKIIDRFAEQCVNTTKMGYRSKQSKAI